MKIGIGVGIGRHQFKLGNAPSGWQLPYAWASLYAPTVTTTQVQNANLTSVVANVTVSANAPVISTASAINQSVSSIVATSTASTGTPTVSTTKSPIITPTVASAQATTGIPTVNAGSVINQSVSSIVASATTSTGTPTVSGGSGATTYYLQMDGVDDYITAPSMTYTKVVVDALVNSSSATETYFIDSPSRSTGGYIRFTNTGTIQSSGQTGLVLGTRSTVTMTLGSAATQQLKFFTRFTVGEYASGNCYDIKIYNGATLVAHYDMSTGNVNDQTGNGYNATNTDGTWVTG